jgi:hypothetical protein
MKVEIREVTRELRHKLESELEKNIMVRDNQSEENDNLNKVIHNIEIENIIINFPIPSSLFRHSRPKG